MDGKDRKIVRERVPLLATWGEWTMTYIKEDASNTGIWEYNPSTVDN